MVCQVRQRGTYWQKQFREQFDSVPQKEPLSFQGILVQAGAVGSIIERILSIFKCSHYKNMRDFPVQ